MTTTQLKTDPVLIAAINRAKVRTPTEDELRKQRVSFIYGSLSNKSSATHEQIKNVLDMQEGRIPA